MGSYKNHMKQVLFHITMNIKQKQCNKMYKTIVSTEINSNGFLNLLFWT